MPLKCEKYICFTVDTLDIQGFVGIHACFVYSDWVDSYFVLVSLENPMRILKNYSFATCNC